jgi:hypothetical protein
MAEAGSHSHRLTPLPNDPSTRKRRVAGLPHQQSGKSPIWVPSNSHRHLGIAAIAGFGHGGYPLVVDGGEASAAILPTVLYWCT